MPDSYRYPLTYGDDRLRHSAETLIKTGATPRASVGALGLDALALLYERASTPELAADTLKLLHELRTHQVEVDLLYEQLRANEEEIVEELAHFKALFELAPVAYLMVANDGLIIEGNQAAQSLFRASAESLAGKALWLFLALDQKQAVHQLLGNPAAADSSQPPIQKALVLLPDQRRLTISARRSEAEDSIMMIFSEETG